MKKTPLMFGLMLSGLAVQAQQQAAPDTLKQQLLEEVQISEDKYKINESHTVGKLALKDLENPQVYNTIPKAVLKDQLVTNLNDALKNATGITRLWESTGRGGDGAEFYSMRGFALQPNLVNGMASISNGGLDPANVENIEVVKGPSGTLYGGNLIAYGGLINIMTKKPYDRLGGEFSYIAGSYGLNRFTADVNAPLSQSVSVRVNTAYHYENTFQDAGFNRSFFIAPSVKFVATDKLSFFVNTEFKSGESANAPMIFLSRYSPLSFSGMDIFEQNYKKSYTSNNLTIKNPSFGLQAQMIYAFSQNWKAQTIVSRSNTKTDGYYQYLWDAANGDEFTRFMSKRSGATNATGIQQNFTGDFTIGKLRNRLVVGVDYIQKQVQNNSSGWIDYGKVSLKNQIDSGILTTQAVDNALLHSTEGNAIATTKILSAYISDVINFSPKLSAMLSLRVDNFNGNPSGYATQEVKNQTTLSPKFGLVYQPVKDKVSLFGNYMNGFVNIDPAQVSDIDGRNPRMKLFDPEHANQLEFGLKSNLWHNKLGLTASYYNIEVGNKVMTDPTNPNNSIQGGTVSSKGIEVSLVAHPVAGLNIISGYSYNDSKVTKDAPEAGYLGMRPEEAGPQNLFNFWANYKIPQGALKNFTIGLGLNAASENKILNRANIGTFTLPGYAIFNASLAYTAEQYSVNLKVDNLSNEHYFSGWSTITPQKLRSLSLGLSFKF
ncbi:TonB-dependent siderophore receptor [Taibaiella sp. KBW10]|uniref:TonB-dependent siderophore receptor n=1 Tax=Taibaiella sp. KBW10 TaxID=2153357 RepID=UPI000F5B40EC|nr:TonB-dependent siderophore receptor [Taibaiella sp. KBW10]RQO31250.1 TonB-dependent siderophore receptor [Taibaiella sp. KBW10]